MTTAFKEVLDDAAAARDLSIDLDDVWARSTRRRRFLRGTGTALMLGAAAAVLGVVAVTSLVAPVVQNPSAATGAEGLPRSWYPSPTYLPELKPGVMPAASLLLTGADGRQSNPPFEDRPVLVSVDGRTYARLPQGPDSSLATLSADGREVAWVSGFGKAALTLHRMTIADARDEPIVLSAPSQPVDLRWGGADLYVTVAKNSLVTYRVHGNSVVSIMDGCRRPLGVDGRGDLLFVLPSEVTGRGKCTQESDYEPPTAWPTTVVDPRGRATASILRPDDPGNTFTQPTFTVAFRGDGIDPDPERFSIPDPPLQVTGAHVLAWTSAGVLLAVDAEATEGQMFRQESTLQLVNPFTGEGQIVGRSQRPWATPVSVAADLIGRPTVAGAEPSTPWYRPARLGYEISESWRAVSTAVYITAAVLLVLAVGYALGRRNRSSSGTK